MSHPAQLNYINQVRTQYPDLFKGKKILEVGSLNINGTVRIFFENCDYLGIDVGPGPGVDLVCQGQDLDHPADTYDLSISCECFEHNPFWVETFQNMIRMTKPGGMIIMSCATTGRLEHGTRRTTPQDAPLIPWDYYKNLTPADFRAAFDLPGIFSQHEFQIYEAHHDLYFYGIKK
jgi:SAM-dependent methyltransferase